LLVGKPVAFIEQSQFIHGNDAAGTQSLTERAAERDEGRLRRRPFEEVDPRARTVIQQNFEIFFARRLPNCPHFDGTLRCRRGCGLWPPSQFAICQQLVPLSDTLIIAAREIGGRTSGKVGELGRYFSISVRSDQWVPHKMPRQQMAEG
jgi:hypothetical protein